MDAKKTMVTLKATDSGELVAFEIDHAERLLNLQGTMWVLEDKNFKFDDHAIKRRENTQRGRKAEQGETDKPCPGAAGED